MMQIPLWVLLIVVGLGLGGLLLLFIALALLLSAVDDSVGRNLDQIKRLRLELVRQRGKRQGETVHVKKTCEVHDGDQHTSETTEVLGRTTIREAFEEAERHNGLGRNWEEVAREVKADQSLTPDP